MHLVRHGQTYFNRYNRLQGWSNSPLTQSGLDDASRAGEKLKQVRFAGAFCSDTTRAEQTAQAILDINENAESVKNPRAAMYFREQFYGYFEGQDMAMSWYAAGAPHGAKTYNEIVEKFGLAATKDFLKQADPFHDAESEEEYWQREAQGFYFIAADESLSEGDDVLLISHGNTLLSLMQRFAGSGYDLSERPANGSVTVIDFDTSRPFDSCLTVRSYNQ